MERLVSLILLARAAKNHRAPTDPYFSFVTSLLHFDGTNGSTTIVDQISGNTWTCHGSAALSNAQSKFGGTSLICNASGDYLTAAASANFALGTAVSVPFTIEFWVNRISASGTNSAMFDLRAPTSGIAIYAAIATTGLTVGVFNWTTQILSSASIINFPGWHHIAVCFDSSPTPMLYFYIDGVSVGSAAVNPAWPSTVAPFMGDTVNAPSQPTRAYYDDMRITKGVNRYPGGTTFTPPAVAFPNS
jgi:hypothetical protein